MTTTAAQALAMDISGSRTMMMLVDADGRHGEVTEVANVTHNATEYWPNILNAVDACRQTASRGLLGCGVSFGGPVNRQGEVLSIHVGGWHGIDVFHGLQDCLQLPVRIMNDANCGALGERQFGKWNDADGNPPHTLIFMTCSTGIGGGIVSDGRLLQGSRGLAGEVGHIMVREDGEACGCGLRGCLEAQCSGTGIARRATRAFGRPVKGAKEVFDAADAGDAAAQALLNEVFAEFGRGIAAIQGIFDADIITIGGGVSLAGKKLTGPVQAEAEKRLFPGRQGTLRLESSSLGLLSQLYGAASLFLRPLAG